MGLTLNQVKRRLESLGNSHRQIRTVKMVGYDEALDGADLIYPACVIELQKDNKVSLRDRLTYFRFKVFFFDQVNVVGNALENEYEIKSDLASIAQDFIAMVNYYEYLEGDDGWSVDDEYNMDIANYQLQDLTAGVMFELQIGVRFDANRCQVPISGLISNGILTEDSENIITETEDYLIQE